MPQGHKVDKEGLGRVGAQAGVINERRFAAGVVTAVATFCLPKASVKDYFTLQPTTCTAPKAEQFAARTS
jgi:hypothetical protein